MKTRLYVLVTLTLVALSLFLASLQVAPVVAQTVACFRAQGGSLWACASGGEMEFRSGSTLDVQAGATATVADLLTTADLAVTEQMTVADLLSTADLAVSEQLTVAAGATVAGVLNLTPATTQVITDGDTLIPAGAIQPISSTAATGFGLITAPASGNLLMIVNVGGQNVVITETASIVMSGNTTLGAGDSVVLAYIGTKYYQLAPESDN
jgi:hypothetical protein